MLISMLSRLVAPSSRQTDQALQAGQPRVIAWQSLLMMLVLLPASLLLLHTDPRLLDGISVWVKPIKFELSLALHFATLAVVVDWLAPADRARPSLRYAFLAASLAASFEVGYIALQAARGRASHFNDGTTLEFILYQVMGVGAVVLVATAFYLGIRILKAPRPGLGSGRQLGAGLGLTLGAFATLVTAGLLASGIIPQAMGLPPGHWVGGLRSDAGGLPLFGWSTTGGDLRVPHFFATHLMQTLPVLGWLADRLMPQQARRLVWSGAILQVTVILGTFVQAVLGVLFWHL